MRRYVYLILFFLVLVIPFVMRRVVAPAGGEVRSSGGTVLRLVIITPHNQDIRREFAWAFSDWHREHFGQAVDVDYRVPGGSSDVKRQLDATYRQWRQKDGKLPDDVPADFDVAWGGGDFFFNNELKPLGILKPVAIDPALMAAAFPTPDLAGVALYDPQAKGPDGVLRPRWVGVCLSAFGIVYNPDLYATLDLPHPTSWRDLTEPKLSGLVALADPTHSGSASVAYTMVLQRELADAEAAYLDSLPKTPDGKRPPVPKKGEPNFEGYDAALRQGWQRGMGVLLRIAANSRYLTDNAPVVPNDVGNGEAAAGVAIDFYGRVYQEAVGPGRCQFIAPPAATAITPDPVAVLHGVKGPRLQVAERFVHFMLTPEGQRLWITRPGTPGGPRERSLRRPPVRRDVYADRTGWTDDVNPFTESGGFNQRQEWMRWLTDSRALWAASWIDARVALRESYATILSVKDEAFRRQLLDELAFDQPVNMKVMDETAAERKRMEKDPSADLERWKALKRIEWADAFRSHYRHVAAKARG
jgi:ABC-type Fe3+ transport system substrate-binding protein